ncbi:MAG: AMIN domain-containing protein [Candidatus Zixiibacteriota bacterium]|nr:MAG: AMIN domain-containing protein [candidate division Zixibacteria bacterium]
MMKRMLTFAVVAVALLAAGQAYASEVTSVELKYADGSTVARINVDGAIRFTHQTEVAKDGKPFRVIVDILSATHKLGTNNFMSLPDCPVKSIRSSQYSVKPEPVVRVVFDMEGDQVYRVDSDNKGVWLYFTDKARRQYAPWSTTGSKWPKKAASKARPETDAKKVAASPPKPAAKSAQELNKTIKKDRLASLEANKEGQTRATAPKKQAKKAVTPSPPKLTKSETHYGPYIDRALMSESEPPTKKESKPVKPAKVMADKSTKAQKPVATKPASRKKAESVAKAEPKKAAKKAKPTVASKPAPAKTQPSQPAKAKSGTKPVVAKAPEAKPAAKSAGDEKASQRSTSRFRRSPVQSKKIKGTLVAEFPKRLVIKYKATRYRDPFATLIDESKTYDTPVERQAPNVEGLKLVGVIEAGSKDNRALFEDKDGFGYILKTGDKVQKGYVLRVEADRVYFQIFEYGWSRTVALYLES